MSSLFLYFNINMLFPSPFLQTYSHAWCLADGVRLRWIKHAQKHEMRTRVQSNKQELRANGFVLKIPLNRLFPLQLRRCVSVDSNVTRCKMCPCAINRSGAHLCRRERGDLQSIPSEWSRGCVRLESRIHMTQRQIPRNLKSMIRLRCPECDTNSWLNDQANVLANTYLQHMACAPNMRNIHVTIASYLLPRTSNVQNEIYHRCRLKYNISI
jgi:hypothetical protein